MPPELVTRAPAPATASTARMAPVAPRTVSVCVPANGATVATWTANVAPAPSSVVCVPARWAIALDQMSHLFNLCGWLEIPPMAGVEGKIISLVTWFMGIVAVRMDFVGKSVERDGRFICSHFDGDRH